MKMIIVVMLASLVISCGTQTGDWVKIVEKMDFDEGQEGCILVELREGAVFLTKKAEVIYKKDTGENAPECEI